MVCASRRGGDVVRTAGRGAATWHMQLGERQQEGPCNWDGRSNVAHAGGRGRVSWSTNSARKQQSQLGEGNEIAHLMLKMPNAAC
jgi:hypothetical protein